MSLTKNYVGLNLYFDKCNDILKFLFGNFANEMEIYYNELIPIFLSLVNRFYNPKSDKEKNIGNGIIDLFLIMTKNENIYSYMNIILDKIIQLFLKTNYFNFNILNFFQKIIKDIMLPSNFYPLITNALIEKIKLLAEENNLVKGKNTELIFDQKKKQFIDKILYIFKEIYLLNKENFVNFLPKIIKNLDELSVISYIGYELFISKMLSNYSNYDDYNDSNYKAKIILKRCFLFCNLGFNYLKFKSKIFKNGKKYFDTNSFKSTSINMKNYITQNSRSFKNKKSIDRKNEIEEDLIIKIFDTSNCLTKKDWYEWFKSSKKILFEQSPSIFIQISKFLSDYNYPLTNEFYKYSFLDIYKKIDETKKTFLSLNLTKALKHPKTPNEILLAIINLEEYSERKNIDMCFLDNYLFGKVSYKCKAYAKALYFFENDFKNKNNSDNLEDLLELYYKLKLPESAFGLLMKYYGKNKNKNRRQDSFSNIDGKKSKQNIEENMKTKNSEKLEKDCTFYIRMHDYQKALEIISELEKNEENFQKIKILKNNKNICLKGLCDWEELLMNNKSELDEDTFKEKELYDKNEDFVIKNKIENNTINTELNEENEDFIIKDKIEKEILLSKACMNLGEWKQLENHLYNLTCFFANREISKDIYLNNNEEQNIFYRYNDMSHSRLNTGLGENSFFINHTLSFGQNKNDLDEDYIHFNKYIENYNIKKLKNENNLNKKYQNINEENKGSFNEYTNFINYNELILDNKRLNYLENDEDILFDLNLYSSILNIENSRFELASRYIYEAKKTILSRIKSLLNESYVRGYELLAKNQLLYNLEQIIYYKKNHFGDKKYFTQMITLWDKNLNMLGNDINNYENFLSIRSLVLPLEQEYIKYLDFVKICRKLKLFNKGEKVLLRLKGRLKQNNNKIIDNSTLNEIFTKIELSYNKCLFEKGQIHESIEKSKFLIDSLDAFKNSNKNSYNNINEISDKIKSKIYGYYAIFKSKNFDIENNKLSEPQIKNINCFNENCNIALKKNSKNFQKFILEENINKDKESINQYYSLALKYNDGSYKLWHNYAMFNYKYYKYILLNLEKNESNKESEIKNEEILSAINSVNGFRNSLFIGGKNKKKTFQDILRLLDIFFSEGNKDDNLLKSIKETFNYIDIDVFLNVIPQLLSRLDITDNKIFMVLLNILTKIGLKHPHSILSALIVMKHSNSKKRKSSAIKVLDTIINKNNILEKLIEEYEIFINELNKCSLLLHEEWSETLEDITSIFENRDYNSFINKVMKLHEKMNKKPNNMYDINFY